MGKMITMTDFLVKFHTLSVVFCPFAIQTPNTTNGIHLSILSLAILLLMSGEK